MLASLRPGARNDPYKSILRRKPPEWSVEQKDGSVWKSREANLLFDSFTSAEGNADFINTSPGLHSF
jgi:hypothetical protein